MSGGFYIVVGIITAVLAGLLIASDLLERKWQERHPPDDGMNEVKFDDENTGS